MKKLHTLWAIVLIIFISPSCQHEEIKPTDGSHSITTQQAQNDLQIEFAKVLAKALQENASLREFLKQEALKQFDKDYDILYQMVKAEKVDEKNTFRDVLTQYASSPESLVAIEDNLPLLTIFVPTLKDFSAEKWNSISDIPQVAVSQIGSSKVVIYNAAGEETVVPPRAVPAFPVVVVKQNERVIVNNGASASAGRSSSVLRCHQNEKYAFSFADEAFNGMRKENATDAAGRVSPYVDPINVEAYNSGTPWHRDYVYFGLTPNNTAGPFRNNYSEFITNFQFYLPPSDWENGIIEDFNDEYGTIADQDEDPKVRPTKPNEWDPSFTEGNFEFRITTVINGVNGAGSEITKIFTAQGSDLFNVIYGSYYQGQAWHMMWIIPRKDFNPNIELVPWDIRNYGMAWKFIIYEHDLSQEITQTYTHTSTHARNFGFDLNISYEIIKLGLNYGSSSTTQTTHVYSIRTTHTADFLGETILTFDQPVITGQTAEGYVTREISTGRVVLSVEPKRVF